MTTATGTRRYVAWWIAEDNHPPDATECDLDLYEYGSRTFSDLARAARFVAGRCLIGDPRVYVEEYEPFWDDQYWEWVPNWEEKGVYLVDPETGDPGEMDRL